MGIFSLLRKDESPQQNVTQAMRAKTSDEKSAGGPLEKMITSFAAIGFDGRTGFASAQKVADRALDGTSERAKRKAVRRIIRQHRRGVTVGGFATGLGGVVTLALTLPLNIAEFYIQAIRMSAAVAAVRGYDITDAEIRTRVLATLVGEEADDLLGSIGLGPVAGYAGKRLSKSLPASEQTRLARAVGSRILKRFGLRSVRLFGKSVPLLGGVVGALMDRGSLKKIAKAADEAFPAR